MKKVAALIFYPGENSFVGLWRPDAAQSWVTAPVVRTVEDSNQVLQALDKLLITQKYTLQQLTHVGVMHGPASYTQLRLFVTTANALAWGLHVPEFSFGPETALPDALPELLTVAKINTPIIPVYPTEIGTEQTV